MSNHLVLRQLGQHPADAVTECRPANGIRSVRNAVRARSRASVEPRWQPTRRESVAALRSALTSAERALAAATHR